MEAEAWFGSFWSSESVIFVGREATPMGFSSSNQRIFRDICIDEILMGELACR